jgi:hypothetical protein
LRVCRIFQPVDSGGITRQQVQTWNQDVHPMNEQRKMNGGIPWEGVPRHDSPAQVTLHSRHDTGHAW